MWFFCHLKVAFRKDEEFIKPAFQVRKNNYEKLKGFLLVKTGGYESEIVKHHAIIYFSDQFEGSQ